MAQVIIGCRRPVEYKVHLFKRGSRWTFRADIEADALKAGTYSTARAALEAIKRANTALSAALDWPTRAIVTE